MPGAAALSDVRGAVDMTIARGEDLKTATVRGARRAARCGVARCPEPSRWVFYLSVVTLFGRGGTTVRRLVRCDTHARRRCHRQGIAFPGEQGGG